MGSALLFSWLLPFGFVFAGFGPGGGFIMRKLKLIHQPGDFHEKDKIFQSIHQPQSPAWLGLDQGQLWQLDSFLTSGLRHILPYCLVTISTILNNYDQLHFYQHGGPWASQFGLHSSPNLVLFGVFLV